jgi:hypothetical protein
MAYMEFSEASVGANAPRASHDAVPAFSALEWLVVALAERDGLVSIGRAGRFATLISRLFERAKPGLASPRLEALRRFAVLAWQFDSPPVDEIEAFHALGYSVRQRDALLASVAHGRTKLRSAK